MKSAAAAHFAVATAKAGQSGDGPGFTALRNEIVAVPRDVLKKA